MASDSEGAESPRRGVDPRAHLPLTPLTTQILVAVAAHALHGYAIVKAVREATEGRINPGTGTFYSAIHRMTEDGMIREVSAPEETDARRRYYAITDFGRGVLEAETERLEGVIAHARSAQRTWAKER